MKPGSLKKYGPWAVIAGASEGIGREIAERLAISGIHLVLLDNKRDELDKTSRYLNETCSVDVLPLCIDLTEARAYETIKHATQDKEVGFYAHIACSAPLGAFMDIDETAHDSAINLNVVLASKLSRLYAPGMSQRKGGGIVFCGSMASLSGFPYNAQYSAGKAYLKNLGEALWYELREYNIDVHTAVISEVMTPSFKRSGSKARGNGYTLTPSQCADEIFASLGKYPSRTTGFLNRIDAFFLAHVIPQKMTLKILANTIKSRFMK